MRHIFVFAITLYQQTLSPDHGLFRARFPHGYCRHYPTCSEYTRQALMKHGTFTGLRMGFIRVLTCNPFVQPRVDMP